MKILKPKFWDQNYYTFLSIFFFPFSLFYRVILFLRKINSYNSDICILPMAWNYYLTTNQIYKANDLIYKAKQYKKKIVVWVNGNC